MGWANPDNTGYILEETDERGIGLDSYECKITLSKPFWCLQNFASTLFVRRIIAGIV